MSITEKSIYFCQIYWDSSFVVLNKGMYITFTDLNVLFNFFFNDDNKNRLDSKFKGKDISIKIESISNGFIFGSFAYLTDYKKEMARQLDKDGNEADPLDFKLEYYSFFLIHIETGKLVYIYNNHLPDIRDFFEEVFKSQDATSMLFFNVTNIEDKNISERLKYIIKPKMYFELTSLERPVIINNAEMIDSCSLGKVSYEINIKRPQIFNYFLSNINFFKKAKLSGRLPYKHDNNSEDVIEEKHEIINLLKRTFSRKTKINVERLNYKNLDTIQEILKNELMFVLYPQYIKKPSTEKCLQNPADIQIKVNFDENNIISDEIENNA